MSVIVSKIPIIADSKKLYKSCTSDDKLMYFISDDSNEIDIFDSDYCYVSKIQIENNYLNITYKKEDDSFFAVTNDNKMLHLDKNFNKLEEMNIDILKIYTEKIVSISYFNTINMLYLVSNQDIIEINLDNMQTNLITENIKKITENSNVIFTSIYNDKNSIYISYIKDNNSYLAKLTNEYNIEKEYYIESDVNINNIFECNNILKLFATDNFNYIYETSIINNEFSRYNKQEINELSKSNDRSCFNNPFKCLINKNQCNCFSKCCNNCNCNCNCCKKYDCKKNLCDVIESIALEETGISHILNSEGEKIQKVLANSDDICEILKVNESVNKTINNIIMLEQILYSKLEIVSNIICKSKCNNCSDNSCECSCEIIDCNNCCEYK